MRDYTLTGGTERLEKWLPLRELAEVSRFDTFFEANRESLDQIVEDSRSEVEKSVAMLADYTRITRANERVRDVRRPLCRAAGENEAALHSLTLFISLRKRMGSRCINLSLAEP